MREFRISEIDSAKTLAKAQKIAQRSKKYGLSGGYQVSIQDREELVGGVKYQYKVLVIEGETLKYKGWEFVGVAQFVQDQVILSHFSDEVQIQASEIKAGHCDQCQTNRQRGKVIFVKNAEGKLNQVGSTCVKDFLGWDFYASALVTEEDFEKAFGGFSGGNRGAIGTLGLLAYAIKAVEKVGYVKSHEAGTSTKDLVVGVLKGYNDQKEFWKKNKIGEVTDVEFKKAEALIEWAKNFEGDSAYAQNVRAVANLEYQQEQSYGIAVSIVKAQNNQKEKQAVEKIEFKKEQYAETGSKIEVEVEVVGSNTFESAYGLTTLFTFINQGGYQFKWFSSSGANVEIGDKIKIKGTVKGSDEYKDSFSTLLTRCKFI
jgi:hypothetical protein